MSHFCAIITMDTHSLLLSLLFDHVGEDLGPRLTLSVQQVCWYGALWSLLIILLFALSLFMHLQAKTGR